MNYPGDGVWTPEQCAQALLCLALEGVPKWAENIWFLALTARDSAPEGEATAWVQAVHDSASAAYAAVRDKILEDVCKVGHVTDDLARQFRAEVGEIITARWIELAAVTAPHGGTA